MTSTTSTSSRSSIPKLTDENYPSWLLDVKAVLRKQKLWKYTQENIPESLNTSALAKWKESSRDAADEMTPTISEIVKDKLQADAFDCGFLMLTQLAALYAPKGEAEFMRLTREYYSLRYEDFDSMTHYLTQIKSLEERIRGTKVILDDDKKTLLCLGMTLPERFQYFTKIWSMTPGITADKARNMLLEEERREKTLDITVGTGLVATTRHPGKRTPSGKAILNYDVQCSRCGKPHEDENCWKLHPELAPEWLQERWTIEKKSRKRKWEELQQDTKAPGEHEAFINL